MGSSLIVLFGVLSTVVSFVAATNFHISNVFGSHMVLQRNVPNPLWGWANPSVQVSVLYQGTTYNTTSSSTDGFWKVVLPKSAASFTPISIVGSVPSTGESQTLDNVLIGGMYNYEYLIRFERR